MFVRIKKHAGSKSSSVLICQSMRHGNRVQQRVLSRIGTAYHPDDLPALETKALEKLQELRTIQLQKKEELVDTKHVPSLQDVSEISRQNCGIPDILGKLYDNLGFSGILSKKAAKTLKSVVLSRFIYSCA